MLKLKKENGKYSVVPLLFASLSLLVMVGLEVPHEQGGIRALVRRLLLDRFSVYLPHASLHFPEK